MAMLSVNVNKLATLRNSRGGNNPDVLKTTLDIVQFGAEGITVHPRPDERHIRRSDVYQIAESLAGHEKSIEFNIEGYPNKDFLAMVKQVKPAQCTLVPDPPEVITSNAGWQVAPNLSLLKEVVGELNQAGVRVSLFYDPQDFQAEDMAMMSEEVKAARIELYTEAYAKAFGGAEQEAVLESYRKTAEAAVQAGLAVNAGHDLDLNNLPTFLQAVPQVKEVSIGHALVCDALYQGLEKTVSDYLQASR